MFFLLLRDNDVDPKTCHQEETSLTFIEMLEEDLTPMCSSRTSMVTHTTTRTQHTHTHTHTHHTHTHTHTEKRERERER
jgi:hypothetical protein